LEKSKLFFDIKFHNNFNLYSFIIQLSGSKGNKSKKTKLQLHACYSNHISSMQRWLSRKESEISGTIYTQIQSGQKAIVDANRDYIKNLIEVTLYLGRQGISFRGHKENKEALNKGISFMGSFII